MSFLTSTSSAQITEEILESGNLFSGSWFLPPYRICSNSRILYKFLCGNKLTPSTTSVAVWQLKPNCTSLVASMIQSIGLTLSIHWRMISNEKNLVIFLEYRRVRTWIYRNVNSNYQLYYPTIKSREYYVQYYGTMFSRGPTRKPNLKIMAGPMQFRRTASQIIVNDEWSFGIIDFLRVAMCMKSSFIPNVPYTLKYREII